jgi:hypothetical protein
MPETDSEIHAAVPVVGQEPSGALAEARRRIAELLQDERLYRELFENSLGLMC